MIISSTLIANNADIVGEAIASVVDHVDLCVIIDTGSTDNSREIAAAAAGRKAIIAGFKWNGSFADARNYALRQAGDILGGRPGWALTVDSDERLKFLPGSAPRHALAQLRQDIGVVLVAHESGSYTKERFIRLPCRDGSQWRGPVHEAFCSDRGQALLAGIQFAEIPKTPDQLTLKMARDLDRLMEWVRKYPEGRWFYYLAECQAYFGDFPSAMANYKLCYTHSSWDEERAWAAYKMAEAYSRQGEYSLAHRWCCLGLEKHAGFAELAWLAGWLRYKLGDFKHAVYWARIARAIAQTEALTPFKRIGFRHQPAYQTGPDDVEFWSLYRMGLADSESFAKEP